MIEPGEGWTSLWGFWGESGHMQVMVLPWDTWGRDLLWDSTSNPSGFSHIEKHVVNCLGLCTVHSRGILHIPKILQAENIAL